MLLNLQTFFRVTNVRYRQIQRFTRSQDIHTIRPLPSSNHDTGCEQLHISAIRHHTPTPKNYRDRLKIEPLHHRLEERLHKGIENKKHAIHEKFDGLSRPRLATNLSQRPTYTQHHPASNQEACPDNKIFPQLLVRTRGCDSQPISKGLHRPACFSPLLSRSNIGSNSPASGAPFSGS